MTNFFPLDMPLDEGRVVVRQPSSTFLELLIGGINLAFLLLFTITAIWGTIENGFTLFLFVPYVFALVITLVVCLFLWNWRKVTLEYERTGNAALFDNIDVELSLFMAGIFLFFWGIYVLFIGYNFLTGSMDSWRLILRYVLLLIPGIVMGPLQFVYLKYLSRLRKFVIGFHKTNA